MRNNFLWHVYATNMQRLRSALATIKDMFSHEALNKPAFRFSFILTLVLLATAPARPGQSDQTTATKQTSQSWSDPWWKHAIIYEVYPRSFQGSNGDGVGDINGITSRLDYLKDLGVDAIWITPMYPSPQVDFGYDIADYTAIDPQYGTMADFDHLMSEAKKRSIRIIMRNNPKRDWYIWRDGKGPGKPPNNWQSWFGHSAWTYDEKTGQWYYHYFYVQQPDLNWRNPEVRRAMYGVLRFWLDKGAAGFRMDAVSRLFEDPNLHDDPILPGRNAFGDPNIKHKYTDDLPEVHDVLREIRALADQYPGNPALISEADEPTIQDLVKMYGANNDEVQLPMDFQIATLNRLSAPDFRRRQLPRYKLGPLSNPVGCPRTAAR